MNEQVSSETQSVANPDSKLSETKRSYETPTLEQHGYWQIPIGQTTGSDGMGGGVEPL